MLLKSGEEFFPTLFAKKILVDMPKVVVDKGAISAVCNGADVMAPGIVEIIGDFKKKDLVVVSEQNYGKSIALGRALLDADLANGLRKGKIIKNLHHIGDDIWKILKNIT